MREKNEIQKFVRLSASVDQKIKDYKKKNNITTYTQAINDLISNLSEEKLSADTARDVRLLLKLQKQIFCGMVSSNVITEVYSPNDNQLLNANLNSGNGMND